MHIKQRHLEAFLLQDEMVQGLLALSRVSQRISEVRAGSTGSIRIATNGAMAVHFLPTLIAAYQRDHSDVNIDILVRSSRQDADWVRSRQIDIGLIDTPVPVPGLNAILFNLHCVCVMHQNDPLAVKQKITPADMASRQLDSLLAAADVTVEPHVSSYFFVIARNITAAGNALTIIDPTNGKANLSDGVTWRPFVPRIHHQLAIVTLSDQSLGQVAAGLYDLIRPSLKPITDASHSGHAHG